LNSQALRVPSWSRLELASIYDVLPADDVDIDSGLAEVDWDSLNWSDRMSFPPLEYRRALAISPHENRYRCASATSEAARVVSAMADKGVTIACTKGVGFKVSLYGGFGGRYLDDIDVMIHQEDKDRAAEVPT
jgi:hypothetical protein